MIEEVKTEKAGEVRSTTLLSLSYFAHGSKGPGAINEVENSLKSWKKLDVRSGWPSDDFCTKKLYGNVGQLFVFVVYTPFYSLISLCLIL